MFSKTKKKRSDENGDLIPEVNPVAASETEENESSTDDLSPEELSSEDPEEEENNAAHPRLRETVTPEGTDVEALEKAYCLGAGIDEESLESIRKVIKDFADASAGNRFNPDAIQKALKLIDYEKNIEKAYRRGLEEGRSESLTESLKEKRSKLKEAASIPHFGGTKGSKASESSIFDVARKARNF